MKMDEIKEVDNTQRLCAFGNKSMASKPGGSTQKSSKTS